MNSNQTATSRIRIHELASELGTSPDEIVEFLREQGERVRDRSTVVGLSAARAVRRHFGRETAEPAWPAVDRPAPVDQRAFAVSPVQFSAPADVPITTPIPAVATDVPQFLPAYSPFAGAPAPVAVKAAEKGPDVPSGRATPPSFFAAKSSRPTMNRSATRPGSRTVPANRGPVVAPSELPQTSDISTDERWRRAGIDSDLQAQWTGAGLRATDAALAEQCTLMGIGPDDLDLRLAGRTTLQRLRDGEPVPSVWARLEEYRQQPARVGSRLTGRFRQA